MTPRHAPRPRPTTLAAAILAAVLACAPAADADAQVTLTIRNESGKQVWVSWTGTSSLGGTTNGISIAPSDFGVNAAGYDLSTFAQPTPNVYQISNFTMGGGRMWFTYGPNAWTFANTGYTPSLANFNDPNFTLRYDKIEAFITGSTDDNLDITAVDAFSIPFTVKAWSSASPSTTTQVLRGSTGKQVADALAAIAASGKAPAPKAPAGAPSPLPQLKGNSPYLVINTNSQGTANAAPYTNSPIGTSGDFVRIIANDNIVAPYAGDLVAAANGAQVPANYDWTNYEAYLRLMDGRAATPYKGKTTIRGTFSGVKPFATALTSPATYDLVATFDPTETIDGTYTVPGTGAGTGAYTITFTGVVTLTGISTIASGDFAGTYNVSIKIPYGGPSQYISIPTGFANPRAFLLDPSGVVGANANYFYKYSLSTQPVPTAWSQTDPYNGGPQNNLLTWAEGDLLAGMNVGTVGSTVALAQAITLNGKTYAAGTMVGTFDSQDWWSLGVTLRGTASGSVYDYYFGYLQDDHDYYNRYAETIYPFTDAYGFAYSDRIADGRAAISWNATLANAIDNVEITILPDVVPPTNPGTTDAVEFGNEGLGRYVLTASPDEIAQLDAGTAITGWTRTGRTIRTFATAQAGTTPVCRFYLPPALGGSHFLGRDPAECSATAATLPGAILEGASVMHMVLPAAGLCPAGTSPVYRVVGEDAGTHHRYLGDAATRDQLVARGWIAEGEGPDRVTMCAPD
jgi:hypothetical protein